MLFQLTCYALHAVLHLACLCIFPHNLSFTFSSLIGSRRASLTHCVHECKCKEFRQMTQCLLSLRRTPNLYTARVTLATALCAGNPDYLKASKSCNTSLCMPRLWLRGRSRYSRSSKLSRDIRSTFTGTYSTHSVRPHSFSSTRTSRNTFSI